jgi:hypothetical protein
MDFPLVNNYHKTEEKLFKITKKTKKKTKKTPCPLVRKRTIPTERPPIVGEVSANFLRIEGVAWSVQRIPPVVNSVLLTEAATFSSK